MGILRVYLALAVAYAHDIKFLPFKLHHPISAVQLFFMISGFYMSLAYSKYKSIKAFYLSRFSRIFLPYWGTLGIILGSSLVSGLVLHKWGRIAPFLEYKNNTGIEALILAVFSNLFIFGQDMIMFLQQDVGEKLHFIPNFYNSAYPLHHLLVISPAWSLCLELVFYLLFPFLVKLSNRSLIIVASLSLLLRLSLYHHGFSYDPWSYRFFPNELLIFLAGILSFRYYQSKNGMISTRVNEFIRKYSLNYSRKVMFLISLFLFLMILEKLLKLIIPFHYSSLLTYILWFFLIPYIFEFTKTEYKDREIGEYSFPIYLLHVFAIAIASQLTGNIFVKVPLALILLFGLSWFLIHFVVAPVDRWRERKVKG